MEYFIETERLKLRKLIYDDFNEVCEILQDVEVMYAWEHSFTEEEVRQWIEKNITRYKIDGYSYFAAIDKMTNQLIGVIGPLVEEIKDKKHIGIAYILKKDHWNKGYAIEGVRGCLEYAFKKLGAKKIIAQIKPENKSSRKVAEKMGMIIEKTYVRYYSGKEMPHLIYSLSKEEFFNLNNKNMGGKNLW